MTSVAAPDAAQAVGAPGGAGADETLAERLARLATSCPGVVRLMAGPAATHLPGRRVEGVRVSDDAVEVHLRAAWTPLPELGARVAETLAPHCGGRAVHVYIQDIATADMTQSEPPEGPRPGAAPAPAGKET
ncbi:MAG: hypothetical protein ACKVWR_13750 [Acidimicrobiales bacterium]